MLSIYKKSDTNAEDNSINSNNCIYFEVHSKTKELFNMKSFI